MYSHTTSCTTGKSKAFGRTRKTPGTQYAIYANIYYTRRGCMNMCFLQQE